MTRGPSRHSRDRRKISYQEGGHAVVARKLGVEVTSVDMTDKDDRLGNVETRSAAWVVEQSGGDWAALARGLYADLMVAVAGAIAQGLAGYADSTAGEHGSDIDNAISFAGRLARIEAGLPPDDSQPLNRGDPLHTAGVAVVYRARAETAALLWSNWPAVERVAGALRKRNRLTQAELDHVIAHGQR